MQNISDVETRLLFEIEQWFPKACADNFIPFYLYYLESKPQHNGGILIARENELSNKDYKIAASLSIGETKNQNFNRLRSICRTLPILSY